MRRFRRLFLSFCHGRKTTEELFEPKDDLGRKRFFLFRWHNLRWRFLTWAMLSKLGLGRLARRYGVFGESKSFLSDSLKAKMENVLCVLEPAQNPYLRWILTGSHGRALPAAWRLDSFEQIRENLPRLEGRVRTIGDFCAEAGREGFLYQRYNLGDYFERLSEEDYRRALVSLIGTASSGARLLYWNSLVPRSAPKDLLARLRPLEKISDRLGDVDKVLFRGRLVVEEVL
jgi:S-adenosylmethionine-diacylglycerol 3-amino-3-carboxypropyl transferase